jgi:hypothetical protein
MDNSNQIIKEDSYESDLEFEMAREGDEAKSVTLLGGHLSPKS